MAIERKIAVLEQCMLEAIREARAQSRQPFANNNALK